jgi:hypothetical protein
MKIINYIRGIHSMGKIGVAMDEMEYVGGMKKRPGLKTPRTSLFIPPTHSI